MTAFNLRRKMQGLSLIEILIALAIGSLLVLGLVEVFAASRTAYQLSTGLARVQENGRFAMEYLQRDLRMAGHLGCVNDQARFLPANISGTRLALASTFVGAGSSDFSDLDTPLRFDIGIHGHEAAGTASGDTLDLSTLSEGAADDWTPAINGDIFDDMIAPVAGSDVVELRFFLPNGAQMTSFDPAASPVTLGFVAGQEPRLTEGATDPGLFGVSDCMNAAVFQATSRGSNSMTVAAGSGINESTLTGNESFVGGQARIYRAESIVYYVGLKENGQPALYRLRYGTAPGGEELVPSNEELVEGIESLQLQYGQDSVTQYLATPTGNIGTSAVASELVEPTDLGTPGNPPATEDNLQIHTWRRVGLVQVGLVVRSTEPAAAYQRADAVTQLSALGVVMEPPNDTLYRTVYEDTIALRNRLFGN
jgi:type IV pilus assembly protein PilW